MSLTGYLVGGMFLSLAYFDLPYNILVLVVAARRWLEERSVQSDKARTPAIMTATVTPPPVRPMT